MKTPLVITVFNEEKTIEKLLAALEKQTRKPEEVIFVDGGSTDRTIEKLQTSNLKKKVLIKPGASIAQGRNAGIKEAGGEIIVMTDAGCIPHHDWFEKITAPFKNSSTDVVAGFYQMTGETTLQKCLACYLGILPQKLNPANFLPSARSIAFKKEIWQKVGGFSEKLERAGEDTLFNYQAKNLGAKFVTAQDALVDWELPKSLSEGAQKFYIYAKGDGQAGIWWHPSQRLSTHNLKISSVYARYLVFLALFVLGFYLKSLWFFLLITFFAYLAWAVNKNYKFVSRIEAIFYLPVIQSISDFCVMAGFLKGALK